MSTEPASDPPPSHAGAAGESSLLVPVLLSVGLIGAVAAAFWPAFNAEFVGFDDYNTIVENNRVHGLTLENIRWAFSSARMGHYHPLTWISYMLEHEVWGLSGRAMHAGNIALHAANTVLVYVLGLRVFSIAARGGPAPTALVTNLCAAVGAAIFGLHPLRVESVAWVTERRDVLSACFLLLAALAYLRSVNPGEMTVRSRGWSAACAGLLLLSVLSKAWGMSFVVVALLLDIWPLRRIGPSPREWFSLVGVRLLAQKWALLLIGVVTGFVTIWAVGTLHEALTLEEWSVADRFAQALYGLWFYISTFAWPVGLSPLYELPHPMRPWESRFVIAYLGVAIGVLVVLLGYRRRPWLITVAGAYTVILLPVLGVGQSGPQMVADRYSYLSLIGVSVMCGAGISRLVAWLAGRAGRAASAVGWLATAGLVVTLGIMTFAQTGVWHDSMTLWSHAIRLTPTPMVRNLYSTSLIRERRLDEAREQLQIVVRERPDHSNAWEHLGDLQKNAGDLSGAESSYLSAVRSAKTMRPAISSRIKLGFMYERTGRNAEASTQFRAATEEQDRCEQDLAAGRNYLTLATSLRRVGDPDGARRALDRAAAFEKLRDDVEAERKWLGRGGNR